MKNKVLIGIGLLVFAVLIGNYLFMRSDLIIGDRAPDFHYENRAGQPSALSDFSGKYIILSFWGSWCIPCRESNQKLKEFYQVESSDEVTIISIGFENKIEDWDITIELDSLVRKVQFIYLTNIVDEDNQI